MSAPKHRPRSESHLRSLAKAVSWRCVGTLDTFLVSFLVLRVTGATDTAVEAATVSGGIAGVEVITKVFLYYFHERVWARFSFGRHHRPAENSGQAAEATP